MFYNSFYGMNFIWWIIWMILIFWVFATPYNIPGQRMKKESAFDILQKRFAAGTISNDEYQEKKRMMETDLAKLS